MTVVVKFAAKLTARSPLAPYALPERFPFLIIEETMMILEPVLLHLYQTHITARGKRWNKNTANANAYDLRDWFDFLEHRQYNKDQHGKPWDLASHEDYLEYHEVLQDLVSRQTGKYFSNSTIERRQVAVERFYAWAKQEGLYVGSFIEREVKKGRRRVPRDVDELAHIKPSLPTATTVPEGRHCSSGGEPVKPLTRHKWTVLKRELGPLPSEQDEADPRPCRTRLATELSVLTGMRVDEVVQLTKAHVQDLISHLLLLSEEEREREYIPLQLTRTKGSVERDVLVPVYLVEEMEHYIDGERAESVKVGRTYAFDKGKPYKEPSAFFLNLPDIKRYAGRPVTTDTLQADFRNACIAAGLVMIEERYDADEPTQVRFVKIAKHSYHDSRHTFAVWKYHSERANGNSEPWKVIQSLLGHKRLQVTLDTYLKVVDVHRELAGMKQWGHFKGLRGEAHA